MRDSIPSMRYSSVCNVLRQWNISLIPILIESVDSMIYIYCISSKNLAGLLSRLAETNRD